MGLDEEWLGERDGEVDKGGAELAVAVAGTKYLWQFGW